MENLINYLQNLAKQETSYDLGEDDWNPQDFSGGNFDDCYDLGRQDERIGFARRLLKNYFNIDYKEN